MTFFDVLRSGKRFYRPTMPLGSFYQVNAQNQVVFTRRIMNDDVVSLELPSAEDLLADDWQVEEVRLMVSASDIYKAYERGLENKEISGNPAYRIVKQLGLE